MKKQTKTLEQYKNEFPRMFAHTSLDSDLQTFQLWGDVMLTANLARMDAISGVKDGRFYVISDQAVGYVSNLTR